MHLYDRARGRDDGVNVILDAADLCLKLGDILGRNRGELARLVSFLGLLFLQPIRMVLGFHVLDPAAHLSNLGGIDVVNEKLSHKLVCFVY